MLNSLRNFTKSFWAKILLVIIIIPFVFWGMGSVFSGGNTNSIAKINNHNVSTQDFADFVNNSKISTDVIKENINKSFFIGKLTSWINYNYLKTGFLSHWNQVLTYLHCTYYENSRLRN